MSRFANLVMAGLVALSAPLLGQKAHAADFVQQPTGYQSGICAHPGVLGTITEKFAYQVRHVPNLPQVGISDFQHIAEVRYQPATEEWPIGRRYCTATAVLSDGVARQVWYLIEQGQGFVGVGDKVEFCVSGFDRWNVYDGGCRVLR